MHGAGRGEVAFIGEVRPLLYLHGGDRFRNQPIEVGIALAVGVSAHVGRHIINIDREIRAMIEIIAAQEVLVRFALAGMLRHNEPRYSFEHFARAHHGPRVDVFA